MANRTVSQSDFIKNVEFNRFGLISVILILVGCLGGLTVGLGAIESTVALIVVIIPTMTTLSFLLAVFPMKWILSAAAVSLSIDLILMTYYLLT
jgi:hypothetical protein